MNKINFIVGDWSGDGHDKTEDVWIDSNKTIQEIKDAYDKSCELTKLTFEEKNGFYGIADNYEDNELSDEVIEIFTKFNCPLLERVKNENNFLYPEIFAEIWFWFVSLSLPDFEYKVVRDNTPTIRGYGYGLFE